MPKHSSENFPENISAAKPVILSASGVDARRTST